MKMDIIIKVSSLEWISKGEEEPVLYNHDEILDRIYQLYHSIYEHDGYGEFKVEMRFLKKGQKEVIVHCGKQYRYIVDWTNV